MRRTPPDFSDAGYGQIGCLFVVGGILVGSLVAAALLLFLPTRLPEDFENLVLRLTGIALLAYLAGSVASGITGGVVERRRALWARAEAIFFGAGFVAAAVTVPLGVHVRVIGDSAGSIVFLATAGFVIWILLAMSRDPKKPPKSPSD